ncbi:MAG: hypothetical protein H0U89_02620 [Acidimicrobiia bacterium]|nr:hypothetical protein [Acidimicrobiia bacterium]
MVSTLRLAFVGKGGAGKSAIAGTLARALARRGHTVLAVDSDPLPGLAFSVGVGGAEARDAPIPDDAVVERADGEVGPRFRLRPGLTATTALDRYALWAPDGVRFLQFGKLDGPVGPIVRSQHAFRQILDELPPDRWTIVGDLPGGTRQPFFGWGSYAQTVMIVVEPSASSLLTARRLSRLADGDDAPARVVAVANKVTGPGDLDHIARRSGLQVVAAVPWDREVLAAERAGLAPIDVAPSSPGVRAVESLAERLIEEAGP